MLISGKQELYACGLNYYSSFGVSSVDVPNSSTPVAVNLTLLSSGENILRAVASKDFSVLQTNRKIYLFGKYFDDESSFSLPTDIAQFHPLLNQSFVDVQVGQSHLILLTSDGVVFTFGSNTFGQCTIYL